MGVSRGRNCFSTSYGRTSIPSKEMPNKSEDAAEGIYGHVSSLLMGVGRSSTAMSAKPLAGRGRPYVFLFSGK